MAGESGRRGGERRGNDDRRRDGGRPSRPNPRKGFDDTRRRDDGRGRRDDDRGHRGSLTTGDGPGGDLPKWVREEITRVTAKERREPTLRLLSEAAHSFASEKYAQALPKLKEAKALSSRTATIRELLGLTLYHTGQWEEGLRELRTFRRLSGETTHMAVEMDCLRAMDKPVDVEKTWALFRELGGNAQTVSEARVVFASFLLDAGRAKEAWKVVGPKRLANDAPDFELREWFVAARAALVLGDRDAAGRIIAGISKRDAEFPGIDDLRSALD